VSLSLPSPSSSVCVSRKSPSVHDEDYIRDSSEDSLTLESFFPVLSTVGASIRPLLCAISRPIITKLRLPTHSWMSRIPASTRYRPGGRWSGRRPNALQDVARGQGRSIRAVMPIGAGGRQITPLLLRASTVTVSVHTRIPSDAFWNTAMSIRQAPRSGWRSCSRSSSIRCARRRGAGLPRRSGVFRSGVMHTDMCATPPNNQCPKAVGTQPRPWALGIDANAESQKEPIWEESPVEPTLARLLA
jgi:hypothetical protein